MSITKMLSRAVVVSVFALSLAITTGCGGGGGGGGGGNSPKALAKQAYDIGVKMDKEQITLAEGMKLLKELEAKVKALPEADQKAFEEEGEKLEKAGKK